MMDHVKKLAFGCAWMLASVVTHAQTTRLAPLEKLPEVLKDMASQRFIQEQGAQFGKTLLSYGDGLVTFANQPPQRNLRLQFDFGNIDQAIRSAHCATVEANFQSDTKIWGRSVIQVQCPGSLIWSATIPLELKVFSHALIAAVDLQADQALTAQDFKLALVELKKQPHLTFIDGTEILGQRLAQKIAAGTVLHREHLNPSEGR
jgi:flagella basal body P-ring formation protein FlgA